MEEMDRAAMIRVQDLVFRYDMPDEPVLDGISAVIGEGEYVGIIGPNGCGKTTFVRHLNGLLLPKGGDVWVSGINTRDAVGRQKIRQTVGMVFQNPDNQIVGMSVEEDVSFGPGNLGLPSRRIEERVAASLAKVGMETYAKRSPNTLSNGEKQLVAIAGVLAMKPRCIVFDEPTTYLDPSARERVLQVIASLNREGMTIIHVSHDMDDITHADTILLLHQGRLVLRETPAAIFSRVEWLKGMGVGVPRMTEMMWRLRQMGICVPDGVLSLQDACREISALVKTEGTP